MSTLESLPVLTEELDQLRVLLAYEDLAIGQRARDTFKRIARRVGAHVDDEVPMWSLDNLCLPHFHDVAVEQAERAEIVIIAWRSRLDFSPEFKLWLERWTRRRRVDFGALILLFDGEACASASISRIRIALYAHAIMAQMDFLSSALAPMEEPAPNEELSPPSDRSLWESCALGINE
jgi:hypothetical protein